MKILKKKALTEQQKKMDVNLWIIVLITMAVYCLYGVFGNRLMDFCKDSNISVWPRLLAAAGMEFGMAGLGITLVCIYRKISFISFGLKKENAVKAVIGTVICFIPYIVYIVLSGQFEGYEPLSIMVTPDLHKSGILTTIIAMKMSKEGLYRSFEKMSDIFTPFSAEIDKMALIKWEEDNPYQELAVYDLK